MADIELTQEDQWSVRLLVLEFIVGEIRPQLGTSRFC